MTQRADLPLRGAAFFDRDGTLNVDEGYTFRVEDLRWQPGAADAVRACNDADLMVILVTNQSGLARGMFTEVDMHAFHARMQADLAAAGAHIDATYFSPFHSDGSVEHLRIADHPHRKPNPGLLRRAIIEHGLAPERCFMVGDSDADTGAASAAGIAAARVGPGEFLPAVERLIAQTRDAPVPDLASALKDRAARARAWLFDHALPLWWEAGFDTRTGAFHEKLDLTGAPVPSPRRVRVQARQTFVYALAGELGWPGPWREAVAAGAALLMQRCLRPDGGTLHLLNEDGQPLDNRRDLYDLAFVVLALSHAGRVLDRTDLLERAASLVDWVEQYWSHPDGGFTEGDIAATPPRRQNPHMHMFEALLALHAATNDPLHLDRASQIAQLFRTRLYDVDRGVLCEYYDEAWKPTEPPSRRVVEPGHCLEWAWLLDLWRRQGGEDWTSVIDALRCNAEVLGVDRSGYAIDAIRADGGPLDRTARLWPQTERLKASLARYERCADPNAARAAIQAFDAIAAYFEGLPPGLWRDRRTAEGGFIDEPSPASSFYHVMLAYSELIRLAG